MVSKRQREAKKKYKLQNPELFPKPEPTPPKDPSLKKKKKKPNGKKTTGNNNNNKDSKFRKRPLRVPGLKPGDSCFICRDVDHIAKDCPLKAEWENNKICLYCRQRGHSLKRCPNKGEEAVVEKLCYNCGENGHSLSNCPLPLEDGGTRFALCFICKEQGHLSKACPKNTHGIYPKGGCCKICSGVTHLAKDCPNKGSQGSYNAYGRANQEEPRRPKVTKLSSGDDLEDDFMVEDDTKVKNKANKMKPDIASPVDQSQTKVHRKQGPKVVTFAG